MTVNQFCDELSKIGRWKITESGAIRRKWSGACPLVAVARAHGQRVSLLDFRTAATRLGLSSVNASDIANAADDIHFVANKIRAKLLTACRLTEQ
jgi:hypothetical protein